MTRRPEAKLRCISCQEPFFNNSNCNLGCSWLEELVNQHWMSGSIFSFLFYYIVILYWKSARHKGWCHCESPARSLICVCVMFLVCTCRCWKKLFHKHKERALNPPRFQLSHKKRCLRINQDAATLRIHMRKALHHMVWPSQVFNLRFLRFPNR